MRPSGAAGERNHAAMKKSPRITRGEMAGNILMVLLFLVSIGMLLFPAFSDRWNELHRSRAAAGYESALNLLDARESEQLLQEAREYNEAVYRAWQTGFPAEEGKAYEEYLNIAGNGIMGRLTVPVAEISLPIYHGTDPLVLQTGVGHLEGSSLPVGGENTHCVLSGHRGLPSAKLFTNLDRLKAGDTFTLSILGEQLLYEVTDIFTVLPEDTEELAIFPGKDYCTLVTCTPYGVNSHRLLVRGERRFRQESGDSPVQGEDFETPTLFFGAGGVLAAVLLSLLVMLSLIRGRKK